ncbi:uncharacterized protein METZ01_LOCUS189251, partial [marine metagenome]
VSWFSIRKRDFLGGSPIASPTALTTAKEHGTGFEQRLSCRHTKCFGFRFDYGGIPLVPDCRNTTCAFYFAVRRNLVEELDALFAVHH